MNRILLILKGCAMGAADVVPGVSGGTIAFITGIYEELLNSIKSLNITAFKLLFRFEIKRFWKHVNGNFLISVLLGVGIAVISLANLMTMLLDDYPVLVWSFFFGLIIASSLLISKEIKKWNLVTVISLMVGVVIAFFITMATPSSTPDDWWFIIVSGAIAICAMILPGISGSFILLLMGKYTYIMKAVGSFDFPVIGLFALGATIGIISFSHILSWLLKKFHTVTIALLTGFMIGSLNKVWPWKNVVETYFNRHGDVKPLIESNVLPVDFQGDAQLGYAILACVVGFSLILGIELVAKKLKKV